MSNLTVRGAGRAQWPERDWPVSSRKTEVERVDSAQRAVDDRRSLGPLASGTARYTSPTAAVTRDAFGEAYPRAAIAQYQRNSNLTPID